MSIEVKNLVKLYDEQKAVNQISFKINKGEIVGKIEGANNVLFYSPDNPHFQEFIEVPSNNTFEINPADLLKAKGSYVYVKLLGAEEKIKRAKTKLDNPYEKIDSLT